MRVLVADHFPDNAESLALLLRSCGHEVETAADGLTALAAMETFRPQAVIFELLLAKVSGWQLAGRLRQDPRFADLLLIALTSYVRPNEYARCQEVGIDHLFIKPADPHDLLTLLAHPSSAANGISS
jgi:CheY-like chemotaxis protein